MVQLHPLQLPGVRVRAPRRGSREEVRGEIFQDQGTEWDPHAIVVVVACVSHSAAVRWGIVVVKSTWEMWSLGFVSSG